MSGRGLPERGELFPRVAAPQRAAADVQRDDIFLRVGGSLCCLWLLGQAFSAWGIAASTRTTTTVAVAVVLLALYLAVTFESFAKELPRRYVLHVLGVIACGLMVYAGENLSHTGVTSDEMYFSLAAGQELLHGNNPYGLDLAAKQYAYPAPAHRLRKLFTATTTGAVETQLPYPGLSVLLYLPADAFAFNPAWITLAAFGMCVALIVWAAPPGLRTLVPLVFLINPEILGSVQGYVEDIPFILMLMATAFFWTDLPVVAGIALGIGCAVKQLPWLDVPIFMAGVFASGSGSLAKRLNRTTAAAAAALIAFAIPNAYFALTKPAAWLTGITEVFRRQYLYSGVGVVSFNIYGGADIPRWLLMAAGAVALAAMVIVALVSFEKVRNALWVAPAIALFFAPRSLGDYFMYAVPVCLMSWFGAMPHAIDWKKHLAEHWRFARVR